MHSPSDMYLQWVLAERLAREAATKFLDRAASLDCSVPDEFPTREVVSILRARANECYKAAMAELDARALIAAHRSAAALTQIDKLVERNLDQPWSPEN